MQDETEYDLAFQKAQLSNNEVTIAISNADIALANALLLMQRQSWRRTPEPQENK